MAAFLGRRPQVGDQLDNLVSLLGGQRRVIFRFGDRQFNCRSVVETPPFGLPFLVYLKLVAGM
jgi:hypothetical protein